MVYEGEWKAGKRGGKGKEYMRGRLVFEGEWVEGVRSGPGVLFKKDGSQIRGSWENTVCIGTHLEKPVVYVGNLLYEGEMENNKPHG